MNTIKSKFSNLETVRRNPANETDRTRYESCKHFNGLKYQTCKAGIHYKDVEEKPQELSNEAPFSQAVYPCLPADSTTKFYQCKTACIKFELPSKEEIEAEERLISDSLNRMMERSKQGLCLHCGAKIERKQVVGRCIYAFPCGCRQGQGSIK